jgi:phenylpropionate dioxygenase-like ring-hydroxylating dioxygenase large terminal subunit
MLNLEARYYVDPSIYDRERNELFARTWQLLGPVSQVAERGEYCAVEIAGHKVFAIRGRDGKLRGFRNLCRHRGARLLEEGNGRCPRFAAPIINGCGPMMAA